MILPFTCTPKKPLFWFMWTPTHHQKLIPAHTRSAHTWLANPPSSLPITSAALTSFLFEQLHWHRNKLKGAAGKNKSTWVWSWRKKVLKEKSPAAQTGTPVRSSLAQQVYHPAWELDPMFNWWLQPVAWNEAKTFCRCYGIQLVSDITVLKNHAKGNKHIYNIKSLAPNQTSIAQFLEQTNEKAKLEKAVKQPKLS